MVPAPVRRPFPLTKPVPPGIDLAGQRDYIIVVSMISIDTGSRSIYIFRLQQQRHAAPQLPLDRTGSRSDPARHTVLCEEILEHHPLCIGFK